MSSDEVGDVGIFGPIVLFQWVANSAIESSISNSPHVDSVCILAQLRRGNAAAIFPIGAGPKVSAVDVAGPCSIGARVITLWFIAPRDAVKIIVHGGADWNFRRGV